MSWLTIHQLSLSSDLRWINSKQSIQMKQSGHAYEVSFLFDPIYFNNDFKLCGKWKHKFWFSSLFFMFSDASHEDVSHLLGPNLLSVQFATKCLPPQKKKTTIELLACMEQTKDFFFLFIVGTTYIQSTLNPIKWYWFWSITEADTGQNRRTINLNTMQSKCSSW